MRNSWSISESPGKSALRVICLAGQRNRSGSWFCVAKTALQLLQGHLDHLHIRRQGTIALLYPTISLPLPITWPRQQVQQQTCKWIQPQPHMANSSLPCPWCSLSPPCYVTGPASLCWLAASFFRRATPPPPGIAQQLSPKSLRSGGPVPSSALATNVSGPWRRALPPVSAHQGIPWRMITAILPISS